MSSATDILVWANECVMHAEENGCSVTKFVFPADFERYMYARMMTDRNVQATDFNVVPTAKSGVTVTTLLGIPCRFDDRLPHGKTMVVYDTGGVTYDPENDDYPEEVPEPKGAA